MELAQGIIVADRFRLVRALGQGGMGAVWLAHHTGLDIPCAVKFIHEEAAQSPELRARFEREARAAAQLRSPHVVQVLDHGVWQGAPYIAMELLEGEDLGQRLHRRGALAPHETLALAVQVGRALAKAHSVGLVHRDLKPANIFLVRDEDREIAKVLDFGVAKLTGAGLDGATQSGAVLGTPFYMSPEQARGARDIDHRSDLWALAVVVYRCITGKLPFTGQALGDLFVKIIVEPLPIPSQVPGNPGVPPGFDAWWMRAAARDPAHRFQTAKELSDALGLALGVTVINTVEVGASMPRLPQPGGPPSLATLGPPLTFGAGGYDGGSRPQPPQQSPSHGGTGAVMQVQPPTPLPASQTPYASGAMLPPSGATGPQHSPTPWPNGASTPALHAISMHAAPPLGHDAGSKPPGRGVVLAAAIAAGLVLGGAAFVALRSGGAHAGAGAAVQVTTAAAPPAVTTAVPAPAMTTAQPATAVTAPAPPPAPTASASAVVTAAPPAPTVTAARAPGTVKPAAAPAGPKPKTDFGF